MAAFPGVGSPVFVRPLRPLFRPRILDAYLLRELAAPFAFALAAACLFWFANIFVLAADYLVNKGASPFLVLRFLFFRIPQVTPYAFPFACLFGTLIGFGRLAADNEISALRTSGVSFWRIVRLPIVAGVGMALVSFLINDLWAPRAIDLSTRSFYQIVYKTQTLPIEPNIFRADPATGNVFFVQSVDADGKTMRDVMIFEPDRTSGFQQILTAKTGRLENATIILQQPVITRVKPDGNVSALSLEAGEQRIPIPLGDTGQNFLNGQFSDVFTMDSAHLRKDVQFRKATGQGGSDLANREMALAQKYSFPFASFIAVLVALPLAVRFGKKGRALGIAFSVLLLFVYYVLVAVFAAFGKNGALDPTAAAWLPNLIMAGAGGGLIWLENK